MGGQVEKFARLNPNASSELMDETSIGDHSYYSLERYLDGRGATTAQRRGFIREYEASTHPGGRLLSEVWSDISRSQS